MPSPTNGSTNPAASPARSVWLRSGSGRRKKRGEVATASVAGCQGRLRAASAGWRHRMSDSLVAASARTMAETVIRSGPMGCTPQYPALKKYRSTEQGGLASWKWALMPSHFWGEARRGLRLDQRPEALMILRDSKLPPAVSKIGRAHV